MAAEEVAKDAGRQLALRAQAARIKAYLPTIQERRMILAAELAELETLLRAERAELTKLMDEADRLGPKKRCPRCAKWKAPTEFNRNRAAHDGLDGCCRSCKRAYRLELLAM